MLRYGWRAWLVTGITLLSSCKPATGHNGITGGDETGGNASRTVLPQPTPEFAGKIARGAPESTPDFPKELKAPKGAPNIMLIMTDDVGFGASSPFGGPIATPTFERLAKAGLRYNTFHTTALCSPTRAALITGRNHHSVATGSIMETGTGFPGYHTLMPKSAATIGEILKQNGYSTAWFGKNHNVPDWQTSQAGPFDLWPTGLGFEYFYGFIGGDSNQWQPALIENTKPIEPPQNDPSYHLDRDLADRAIGWMRMQNSMSPSKPFFLYYTTGTSHAPHHAPKDWIAKFQGQFDQGWDKVREETFARQKQMRIIPANAKLTARPKEIPAWDSLTAAQKKVYARMMEVYAAALAHADYQIGRVIDAVAASGELDNTLIMFIQGDNGASAEGSPQGLLNEMTFFNGLQEDLDDVLKRVDELGGPNTYNHYPVGWAHAMDTPFQWTKQVASHFGGTRNGMVISWPKRIADKGSIRTQFHHVIDVVPTLLEAANLPAPSMVNGVKQKPIEGVSMAYSFNNASAPSTRTTQYFEMLGNRAIYHDGWLAATTPINLPWTAAGAKGDVVTGYQWELYHVANDFSEAENLASKEKEKLSELQDLFWEEAERYNVLPLDHRKVERMDVNIRPSLTRGRHTFVYYPGQVRIPEGAAPDLKNKSFSIQAEIEARGAQDNGVLATLGGRFSGWALYVKNGKPVFHYNLAGVERYSIAAKQPLSKGRHTVTFSFAYDGGGMGKGGTGTLSVDDKAVAEGKLARTLPIRFSIDETLDIGQDTGTPINDDYTVPNRYNATLEKVTISLK